MTLKLKVEEYLLIDWTSTELFTTTEGTWTQLVDPMNQTKEIKIYKHLTYIAWKEIYEPVFTNQMRDKIIKSMHKALLAYISS